MHMSAYASGHRTPCTIYRDIDYRADVIRLGFPRTCIDTPRWVRLGVVSTAKLLEDERFCIDDALADGYAYGTRDPSHVRLSDRLYSP